MNFRHLIIPTFLLLTDWMMAVSPLINAMLPKDSRPGKIEFPEIQYTLQDIEVMTAELDSLYPGRFNHGRYFLEAGITQYKGPETCLECHREISVQDPVSGVREDVDLLDNLLNSAHYQFHTSKHDNVWGFNGKLADNFKMGKIDRPCPKPGSFAFTAWAEWVVTAHGDTLSEGCGQCHIGGQYQAPLGDMMPFYGTMKKEWEAIDCLICHSETYDMNRKQVIADANERKRWGQDRSMSAAVSVESPTSENCLRCHQHNFGGDIYIDRSAPQYMQSLIQQGADRPRVLHPGSKRGTPFSPEWDVHAAAGVNCIECHETKGHLIAKGTHTTTMMTNDLPEFEVSCTNCHGAEPHSQDEELAESLNDHLEYIACQTCHIPELHPDNATMRDFSDPVFEEEHGIYIYNDVLKESQPGKGIKYIWWNGDATFLGNPVGDNPNGAGLYRFYNPTHVWPEFKDFNYENWYENVMRPIAAQGRPSKIYPMKLFNGKQHIDLQNAGPFGGMFLPYNLPQYYMTGDPSMAVTSELKKPMMKMMYGWMFDIYMMNRFMSYMDDGSGDYLKGWDTRPYDDLIADIDRYSEPRWIPQDALLEISHSIRREGAFSCQDCHSENSVMDWKLLGYSKDEIDILTENPLE